MAIAQIGTGTHGHATPTARALPLSGIGPGTLVTTQDGVVPVEWLRTGDMIVTFDGSLQPIKWIGRDCLRYPPDTVLGVELHPEGSDSKHSTILTSRHRVLLSGWQIELYLGLDVALAEVGQLTTDLIRLPAPDHGNMSCALILMERPQIIQADGFWVETLQVTDAMIQCLSDKAKEQVIAAAPDMDAHAYPSMAQMQDWEARDLGLNLIDTIARDAIGQLAG